MSVGIVEQIDNSDVRFSASVNSIAKALSSAQGKFKPIPKTAENPYFKSKYADLAGIIEVVKAELSANEIAVTQIIIPHDEFAIVETLLLHSSGEWIKSRIALKPTKADPQGFGSALTYARRYALSAILGVAAEDDDDANAASAPAKPAATASAPAKPAASGGQAERPVVKNPSDPISDAQVRKLHAQADAKKIPVDTMKQAMSALFGKSSSRELTKGEASQLIDLVDRDKLAEFLMPAAPVEALDPDELPGFPA